MWFIFNRLNIDRVYKHPYDRYVFSVNHDTMFKFSCYLLTCLGNDRSILLNYIQKETSGLFQCTLCGKTNAQKNNIMNHVEGIHFPDSFIYQCQICCKTMKTKNALYLHTNTFHKDKN